MHHIESSYFLFKVFQNMEHVSMFDFETFKSGLQVQKSIFFRRKIYSLD